MLNIKLETKNSNDLHLDNENIRFFHIKDMTPEEALIMVEKNGLQKLIDNMVEKDFNDIFYLHVNKANVVKDGNRRLLCYRIATGYAKYKWLVEKYNIKRYGELKKTKDLPVLIYESDDDLAMYVRSQHLISDKSEWTASTTYTYFYKLYIERVNYDFPIDILTRVRSVKLFLDAISFAKAKEQKEMFEKAYEAKVSTLYRAFGNIKLFSVSLASEISLANLMKFNFDNDANFTYDQNITDEQYKTILLEITDYVVSNGVGAKRKEINEFPKSFEILKKIFNIKSSEPTTKSMVSDVEKNDKKNKPNKPNDATSTSSANKSEAHIIKKQNKDLKQAFFLENNLSLTYDKLKDLKNKQYVKGWWQRTVIENASWYLVAKSFKKILNCSNFDFIDQMKCDHTKIDQKYKELFSKLKELENTIEPLLLGNLVTKIKSIFNITDKLSDGTFLFDVNEQRFLKWIHTDATLYISNLNNAAHGKWSHFEENYLNDSSLLSLFENLMLEWKKDW